MTGDGLEDAFSGVGVVFYLVHSMGRGAGGLDFAETDRRAARHVVRAAERAGARRIVYAGGLGDDAPGTSRHLESRREVGRILRAGATPVTELRAGIVLGSGGSSFEMMVQLVEHLPVMICPLWIDRRCQPIALRDLVEYLALIAEQEQAAGRSYDVGGPDVLPYSEMLLRIGTRVGRQPCLVVVPYFTPSLSSHWVGYVTTVPAALARPLIDGMYVDSVCRESTIRQLLPTPLTSFDRALEEALHPSHGEGRKSRLLGGHLARPFEGKVLRLYRRPPPIRDAREAG